MSQLVKVTFVGIGKPNEYYVEKLNESWGIIKGKKIFMIMPAAIVHFCNPNDSTTASASSVSRWQCTKIYTCFNCGKQIDKKLQFVLNLRDLL